MKPSADHIPDAEPGSPNYFERDPADAPPEATEISPNYFIRGKDGEIGALKNFDNNAEAATQANTAAINAGDQAKTVADADSGNSSNGFDDDIENDGEV